MRSSSFRASRSDNLLLLFAVLFFMTFHFSLLVLVVESCGCNDILRLPGQHKIAAYLALLSRASSGFFDFADGLDLSVFNVAECVLVAYANDSKPLAAMRSRSAARINLRVPIFTVGILPLLA
jgi:hypothetical protein